MLQGMNRHGCKYITEANFLHQNLKHGVLCGRMSPTTAALIIGFMVTVGIGVTVTLSIKHLCNLLKTIAVLKAAGTAKEAAFLSRQLLDESPKPPEKMVAEMPEIDVSSMADNPKAMKNLRAKQSSSSTY